MVVNSHPRIVSHQVKKHTLGCSVLFLLLRHSVSARKQFLRLFQSVVSLRVMKHFLIDRGRPRIRSTNSPVYNLRFCNDWRGGRGGILDYNLTLAAAAARIWQSSLIMSDHICIPGKLAEERQMIQAFLSRGKKWKKQIESLFCVIDWTYLKTEHTRVCCVPDSCVIERIRCGEVMLKRLRKGCCSVTFQLNDLLTVNDSWWPEVCFLNSLL